MGHRQIQATRHILLTQTIKFAQPEGADMPAGPSIQCGNDQPHFTARNGVRFRAGVMIIFKVQNAHRAHFRVPAAAPILGTVGHNAVENRSGFLWGIASGLPSQSWATTLVRQTQRVIFAQPYGFSRTPEPQHYCFERGFVPQQLWAFERTTAFTQTRIASARPWSHLPPSPEAKTAGSRQARHGPAPPG